ncbi:hypothetical protein RA268_28195, partial [Pseudomonas syringae pv. tagetis]
MGRGVNPAVGGCWGGLGVVVVVCGWVVGGGVGGCWWVGVGCLCLGCLCFFCLFCVLFVGVGWLLFVLVGLFLWCFWLFVVFVGLGRVVCCWFVPVD